ncbi:hypothetical protein [Aquimarina sp. MAR_2010_214]|nr:hypothetical protein [Aquimarina sp. MAR_2010_214]
MTQEELYQYMLAYQKEHQFCEEDQSNFIALLEALKPSNTDTTPSELSSS